MWTETINELCNSDLYSVKVQLISHVVEDIQELGVLEFLNSIPREYIDVYIKQTRRRTSQRKNTRLMKTVGDMENKQEKTLRSSKEGVGGCIRGKEE